MFDRAGRWRQVCGALAGALVIAVALIAIIRVPLESNRVIPAPDAMAQASASPDATSTPPTGSRCSDGELRIGDLALMDPEWQLARDGIAAVALAWEPDAIMTGLRVGCGILEAGFRWQGIYYSPSAQAFLLTDTGQVKAADFDPTKVVELPDVFSFGTIRRTLAKAGFADDTVLNASTGVMIQMNSIATPFGPGSVPENAMVCHVALEYLGEIRDLFITLPDGTIYRHTFP